jgi:hypothetical protein
MFKARAVQCAPDDNTSSTSLLCLLPFYGHIHGCGYAREAHVDASHS